MARRKPIDWDDAHRRAFISKVSALLKPGETAEDHPGRVMTAPTPDVLAAIIADARYITFGSKGGQ